MANAPFHVFAKGLVALGAKLENLSSDALKCLLFDNTHNPSAQLASSEFVQDLITAGCVELAAANGYSTGGVALSSVTWAATAANSWTATAAVSTAYSVGDIVRPSTGNGFLYECVVAGTSGGTAPTWPTVVGTTVADGTATWLCIGSAATVLGAANIVFTSVTGSFTGYYGLVYDSTPGAYASDPILGYFDISNGGVGLTASGGGTLTITVPSPSGMLALGSS